jgi:hypothetical protein
VLVIVRDCVDVWIIVDVIDNVSAFVGNPLRDCVIVGEPLFTDVIDVEIDAKAVKVRIEDNVCDVLRVPTDVLDTTEFAVL